VGRNQAERESVARQIEGISRVERLATDRVGQQRTEVQQFPRRVEPVGERRGDEHQREATPARSGARRGLTVTGRARATTEQEPGGERDADERTFGTRERGEQDPESCTERPQVGSPARRAALDRLGPPAVESDEREHRERHVGGRLEPGDRPERHRPVGEEDHARHDPDRVAGAAPAEHELGGERHRQESGAQDLEEVRQPEPEPPGGSPDHDVEEVRIALDRRFADVPGHALAGGEVPRVPQGDPGVVGGERPRGGEQDPGVDRDHDPGQRDEPGR